MYILGVAPDVASRNDDTCDCHARVFARVIFSKPYQGTVSTFVDHGLEGKLTFGDPFQDSSVAGGGGRLSDLPIN